MAFRRTVAASVAVAALVALAVSVPTQAFAASTLRVGPGEQYSGIQAAVNAAHNGDTVSVDAGTYVGNVTINGKYITLTTSAGAVIQAGTAGPATVFIENVPFAPGVTMTLSGFTITAGSAGSGQGGGITAAFSADPIITGNNITGNRTAGYGGGIAAIFGSDPVIKNNTISHNGATQGGGGVFANGGSNPTIFGNTITQNSTSGANIPNGGSSGGGIYVEGTTSTPIYPTIMNNTITNNFAEFAGGGIMVRTSAISQIQGNDIESNSAAYGGGIHLESAAQEDIYDNQIKNNTAPANSKYAGSGFGGGISVYDNTAPTIHGNTIEGNQSSNGGAGIVSAEGASVTLDGNLISGNATEPNNTTGQNGGGIYVANATLVAFNNQFVSNTAGIGGAIALLNNAHGTIYNNTVVSNNESADHGGAIYVLDTAGATAKIINNILTANQGYQLYEQATGSTINNNLITAPGAAAQRGAGLYWSNSPVGSTLPTSTAHANISPASVGFTNAGAGDYSLVSTSAAVKAGTSSGIPGIGVDYRNTIRKVSALDIGAFEYSASPTTTQTVYRFFSTISQDHFYTITPAELTEVVRDYNPKQWRYEGIAYNAFTTQAPGTVPLYRFFSPEFGGHFYTASASEWQEVKRDYPPSEWTYEEIAFYVYPLGTAIQSRAVYRFWSPSAKQHFYTASPDESAEIQRTFPPSTWTYEGPNFNIPD
jgi:parallel beta-helix repeat protein/predicted outer membrane repeat protein